MSIYLKIITEQKNKNPEKKWPSREKGKNGDKNVFEEKISRIREKVGEKELKGGHFSFDFFIQGCRLCFFSCQGPMTHFFIVFSPEMFENLLFLCEETKFFCPSGGAKDFFCPEGWALLS